VDASQGNASLNSRIRSGPAWTPPIRSNAKPSTSRARRWGLAATAAKDWAIEGPGGGLRDWRRG